MQNKTILGAVLDAQDSEPPKLDSPLFTMENIILTPHIGWKTLDSRQRLINIIADNIGSFINGCPINVVRTN